MAEFGKIGWGLGSFGISVPTGFSALIEFVQKRSSAGVEEGTPAGTGIPAVYTVSQFEDGLDKGTVTPSHVRAAFSTFAPDKLTPVASSFVLKAKSWAPVIEAFVRELTAATLDMGVIIRIWSQSSADLGASLLALGAINSVTEDILASIHGFVESDVLAYLRAQFTSTADLGGSLQPYHLSDILAALYPFHTDDFTATLEVILGVDLPGVVQTIPGWNLPTTLVTIPGVDLGAIGGGHFPVDFAAAAAAVPPVELPAEIRGGFSDTLDLAAELTQTGEFRGLQALLQAALPNNYDILAKIGVISQATADLAARLQPYRSVDLGAELITERIYQVRAIIAGWVREATSDFSALIRRVDSLTTELSVTPLKAVVSTHTGDRLYNLDRVVRPFFQNRYAFGTSDAGLFILTLEPVYGTFPDLHAEIVGVDFYRKNLTGFIRGALRVSDDLGSAVTSVVSFANVRRFLVDMIPLLNLPGDLVQVGGFLPVRASIRPVHKGITGQAPDAGFVSTAASYKFFIGTSAGLFVPPQIVSQVRISTYRNSADIPDLRATIEGWYETNLGASISYYPFSDFAATAFAIDLSHLTHLSASIASFKASDLGASLTQSGGFEFLPAALTVQGQIGDISASVVPAINPIAFNVVSVSTMPTSNLGAIINYGSLITCQATSLISAIGGYIKPIVTGTDETIQNLAAELNVLRIELPLTAEIVGRRRTRVRILSLTFRAKTRDSERIRGSITPVIPTSADLPVEIVGLLHEADLPATLVPVRYAGHDVDYTATETVANLSTGEIKSILVSFRSQVSSYIYEEVSNAVYATDRGTWAIDLRTLVRDESFYDRSPDSRELVLNDGLQEFFSLDEALRNAIIVLCERRQVGILAQLTARGQISDFSARIDSVTADRILDMSTSLVAVLNSPDISASISGAQSGLAAVLASIIPGVDAASGDLGGSVTGNIINDLSAEVTAV